MSLLRHGLGLNLALLIIVLLLSNGRKTSSSNVTTVEGEDEVEDDSETLVKDAAAKLGLYLLRTTLSNKELGVTTMQEIFDSSPYAPGTRDEIVDSEKLAESLAHSLHHKVQRYFKVLGTTEEFIRSIYEESSKFNPPPPRFAQNIEICCGILPSQLSEDPRFGRAEVDLEHSCLVVPPEVNHDDFLNRVSDKFRDNLKANEWLKWQYYITEDFHLEYPSSRLGSRHQKNSCGFDSDVRHRGVYISAAHPRHPKYVLIILDSDNLSRPQIELTKFVVSYILSTLTLNLDEIGLIIKAEFVSLCEDSKLTKLTEGIRNRLLEELNQEMRFSVTKDHYLAFEEAQRILKNSDLRYDESVTLIYISRGRLTQRSDRQNLFLTLAKLQNSLRSDIVINTIGLLDHDSSIRDREFLEDIAAQDFQSQNVTFARSKGIRKGRFLTLNSSDLLSRSIGDYFQDEFPQEASRKITGPIWDESGEDFIVSFTQSILVDDRTLVGVVGLDVHFRELFEDVVFFNEANEFAFILDEVGNIVVQPRDFRVFDNYEEDEKMLILSQPSGSIEKDEEKWTWKQVENSPYIVVIISVKGSLRRTLAQVQIRNSSFIEYHDFSEHHKLCRHFRTAATMETGSIYLSPLTFIHPFQRFQRKLPKKSVKNYMAYLRDGLNVLPNPGLRKGIKNEVATLVQITESWKIKAFDSGLNNYIVRRYVGTPSGILYVFPGIQIPQRDFDPTKQEWYLHALAFPGKVVLSSPRLDPSGGGYVVTLSHTIYEGKAAALHSPTDEVAAVMAMDLTLGYVHKMLISILPFCSEETVRCFIFDDTGYLISHPKLFEGGPVEKQHLTHIEPQLASDLLNHEGFVRKRVCRKPKILQRFYEFNTSYLQSLTNLIHHGNEHCNQYVISLIPGTNVFAGFINATCSHQMINFCPCKIYGRQCIYCTGPLEQNECECPCECPDRSNTECSQLLEENNIPLCREEQVQNSGPVPINIDRISSLPECFQTDCERKKSRENCYGVMGCNWCDKVQSDSFEWVTSRNQFCSRSEVCFEGRINSLSPYQKVDRLNNRDSTPLMNTIENFRSSPIGPIAGGIMGFFIFLAMTVYCYRQYTRSNETSCNTTPGNGTNDSSLRMSRLEDDEDEDDDDDIIEDKGHHNAIALSSIEVSPNAIISPYRMNPGYRRPPPGTDSDHGYSTMTPMGDLDSEILPAAEINTQDQLRIRIQEPPQVISKQEDSSALLPLPATQNQTLLNSNQFIVSATVHMVDTQ